MATGSAKSHFARLVFRARMEMLLATLLECGRATWQVASNDIGYQETPYCSRGSVPTPQLRFRHPLQFPGIHHQTLPPGLALLLLRKPAFAMGQQASKNDYVSSEPPAVVGAVRGATDAVKDSAGAVKETVAAVGAEDREAIRIQTKEQWGRVEDGDTFWDLSERYLGDGLEWETLRAACSRELGTEDPLLLLPGSHVTEACVARAQARILQKR